uniref:Uncharacterized protein n=1 Tax=Setaria digitata TaxID=48799 RepID=A0A915Q3C5_9BILA
MAADDDVISGESENQPSNDAILSTNKNAEVDGIISDDTPEFGCRRNITKKEQKVVNLRLKQRTSMQFRKSIYRTRSKAQVGKFEITYDPPPISLKPILLNTTQKTVRHITMRAKGWDKHKRVHFHSTPNIYDITPRSGKIPGIIKMPDSPPITKKSATLEVVCGGSEHDVSFAQPDILSCNKFNKSGNETVRFLPAISKTLQCSTEKERISGECSSTKNDRSGSNGAVAIVVSDDQMSESEQMEIDNSVSVKEVVNQPKIPVESGIYATGKRTKRSMEGTVTWVRGDRLRSLTNWMKEDMNENKENANLISNNKEGANIQQCSEVDDDLLHQSLLVVPRTGPKAKVKKWLQDIPKEWNQLIDREDILDEQKQFSDSEMQPDNSSSAKQSSSSCVETREIENKCRRRSLCLQKAVIELPVSKRRQTIVVGEVKGSLNEQDKDVEDDVVLLEDENRNNTSAKFSAKSTRQATTNKSETVCTYLSTCRDQFIDGKTNCIQKYEKKPGLNFGTFLLLIPSK